jgi:hypothetical protein
MSKSLSVRVHEDRLLWDMIKAIGYGGFPFRELAAKLKPLVGQYGARKVSAALIEVASHVGWVTTLNPAARKTAWGVLGFPPESWDWVYRDGLGNPTPRPPEHQSPPLIPPPQPDLFLDSLARLIYSELEGKLKEARRRNDAGDIGAVESEMIRRGMDIPCPDEKPPVEEKPKKKARTRKAT